MKSRDFRHLLEAIRANVRARGPNATNSAGRNTSTSERAARPVVGDRRGRGGRRHLLGAFALQNGVLDALISARLRPDRFVAGSWFRMNSVVPT